MPVLVDGNNLLHAAQEAEPDRPAGRTQLCEVLGAWARRTGESIHVIFDGPPPSAQRAEQIADDSIVVSYSGAGVSADDVLTAIVEDHSAARRLLVVSTDREIVRAIKRRGATPIRSREFWARVQRDLARPIPAPLEPEEKHTGPHADEVGDWLREFGFTEEKRRPADPGDDP